MVQRLLSCFHALGRQGWGWLRVWAACALALLVVLPGIGQAATDTTAQGNKPTVIRFSHVVADDTPKGLMALRFQALMQLRSQGAIRVEIYSNAKLYGDLDEIEALQQGAVEMLAPSLSKFGRIGFPEFELFDLPFLFASEADVRRITQGPLGQRLLQRLQRQQLVGLGFLDNGFKHMSANRPLLEPGDYQGLRMRVQSSRTISHQMYALGARPVVLPFRDTRRALQTGLVHGTENPISNFWTQRMHEVQSDLTLTQHGYLGYAVVVGQAFWDHLSADQKALVQQALDEALTWGNSIAAGQNEQALTALRAKGTTRIHALNAAQRQRLRSAVQPVYDDLAKRIDPSWMTALQKTLVAN